MIYDIKYIHAVFNSFLESLQRDNPLATLIIVLMWVGFSFGVGFTLGQKANYNSTYDAITEFLNAEENKESAPK